MPVFVLAAVLAGTPNPYLDEARRSVDALKFTAALEQLALAEKVPTLDNVQRKEMKLLEARCHIAQGDRARAVSAFEALLKLEPSFMLDEAESPKILELFQSTKEQLFPRGFVALEVSPVSETISRLRLVDPWRAVARVVLLQRSEPSGAFDERELPLEAGEATVHAAQWYAEARDEKGTVLARYASAEAPIGVAMPVMIAPRVEKAAAPPQAATHSPVPGVVAMALAVVAASVATGLQLHAQQLHAQGMMNTGALAAMQLNGQAQREAAASIGCFVAAGLGAAAGVVLIIGLP